MPAGYELQASGVVADIHGLDLHASFDPVRDTVGDLKHFTTHLRRGLHQTGQQHLRLAEHPGPQKVDPEISFEEALNSITNNHGSIGRLGIELYKPAGLEETLQDQDGNEIEAVYGFQMTADEAAEAKERSKNRAAEWQQTQMKSAVGAAWLDDGNKGSENLAVIQGTSVMNATVRLPDKLLNTLMTNTQLEQRQKHKDTVGEKWNKSLSTARVDVESQRVAPLPPQPKGYGQTRRKPNALSRVASCHAIYHDGKPGQEDSAYTTSRCLGDGDWAHHKVGTLRHATYIAATQHQKPRQMDTLKFSPPTPRHTQHPYTKIFEKDDTITYRWGEELREKGTREPHHSPKQFQMPKSRAKSKPLTAAYASGALTGPVREPDDAAVGQRSSGGFDENGIELDLEECDAANDTYTGSKEPSLDASKAGVAETLGKGLTAGDSENIADTAKVHEEERSESPKPLTGLAALRAAAAAEKVSSPTSQRLRLMQDKFEKKCVHDRINWLHHDHVGHRSGTQAGRAQRVGDRRGNSSASPRRSRVLSVGIGSRTDL